MIATGKQHKTNSPICGPVSLIISFILIFFGLFLKVYFQHQTASKIDTSHAFYDKIGIVSDSEPCNKIAFQIYKHHNNIIDAIISLAFCVGLVNPQSSGIGGGFFLAYKNFNVSYTLNAREMAPLKATEDMFVNESSLVGGLAIAVPGQVKGLHHLHQKFGKLGWDKILQPTIDLAKNGYATSEHLSENCKKFQSMDLETPNGFEIFLNENGKFKSEGVMITDLNQAMTLEKIAKDPADFYSGRLARDIALDIQEAGGIVSAEDLNEYVIEEEFIATETLFENLNKTLLSLGTPSGGPVLSMILGILDQFASEKLASHWPHLVAETMKFAYGSRTKLGDNESSRTYSKTMTDSKFWAEIRSKIFINQTFNDAAYYGAEYEPIEDAGTSHMSILTADGEAVSLTSTINTIFGSKVRGKRTGIFFNNEMDDFSTRGKINNYGLRPSAANFIVPGKRPLSSMCPSIISNEKGIPEMVIGGVGGSRIITATALNVIRKYFENLELKDAVDLPRFHHQLLPNVVEIHKGFEEQFPDMIDHWKKTGHKVKFDDRKTFAPVIYARNGVIEVKSDNRKSSGIYGE